MRSATFERFAGVCAVFAGVAIFAYSVSFVLLRDSTLSGFFLMLSGVLSSAALVAVYGRLRDTDPAFALWALLLGIAGAVGSAVHGGYDLANGINPPAANPLASANLPSEIDPRGLLTFGVAGLGIFVFAWLIGRGRQFPRGLGYVGYLLGILLLVIYLARLIVLNVASPLVLGPAVVAGFIVNPLWYLWLGVVLLTQRK